MGIEGGNIDTEQRLIGNMSRSPGARVPESARSLRLAAESSVPSLPR